ncbi:MAG: hypothetical protein E7055_16820 [Lentisphaerae bacterium]|nr:hypothetical protein [Lentisphaerota bacterium]
MVILNRVMNILILLAAIAAVVFSYLLFSKREKLVNGWAQMASAITTAAKTLDDGGASGTTAVKDLPDAKLKHTNSDELGQVLPKLKDNISKVITQRNDLSKSMQDAAAKLSIAGVDSKNIKSVTAYKDQERIFLKGVQDFRNGRDTVSREYANTFSKFGVSVSANDLNDPKRSREAIDRGNVQIQDALDRRNTYASSLGQLARAAGVAAPNVNGPAYRAELNKTVAAVKKKTAEFNKTKSLLAAEQRKTKQLTAQLEKQTKTLKSVSELKDAREREINRLNNILSKDGTLKIPEKLLTSKDPECYKYVKGIIEYIDKDYGFVTINIGKNYSFIQEYGTKQNRVLFPLQAGKIMTVVRNPDSDNPVFIGKIIVTKVDDSSSVCNLLTGKSENIQEGDVVFFTDEDIEKALSAKPKTAKK